MKEDTVNRLAPLSLLAASAWLVVAHATAQPVIRTRHAFPDVLVESVDPLAGCSGDLHRGELTDLVGGFLPPYLAGVACPFTLASEGVPGGADHVSYYQLYDPATGGPTSNMAFLAERHLAVVQNSSGMVFRGTYFVSLPLFDGTNDVANTAAPELDKCVGDVGGPASPDGIITADDLICSWWTGRATGQGSFMLTRRDAATASWKSRSGSFDTVTGAITFAGDWTEEITQRDEGIMVSVDGDVGTDNVAMVSGGDDPAYTGRVIEIDPGSGNDEVLVAVPPHSMYRHVDEILCGLEGVDWVDADFDGFPDTCTNGIFDGVHAMTACTFDNVADDGFTDNLYACRTVLTVFGTLRFAGFRFDLTPGHAYRVFMTRDHSPTIFLSPHF